MKILYAFQGTGNGHVARARDLVPRFAKYGDLDVLVAGKQVELALNFPIAYHCYGLSMVYNKKGGVSYWNSLTSNKLLQFFKDVLTLPVKQYDLVLIDFEAIASYACLLRGVPALQLSHQAAYWSKKTPRPPRIVRHWEWVLRYMSPAKYKLGFHFEPYDRFVLPPIIRQEVLDLTPVDGSHYTVYLPAYSSDELGIFFARFPHEYFHIFTKEPGELSFENCTISKANNEEYLQSFRSCRGLITGGGFEAPAEALHLGKKVLVRPVAHQYEQEANAACAARLGVPQFGELDDQGARVFQDFFVAAAPKSTPFPNYADQLVAQIVHNAQNGRDLDDISGLDIW